MTIPDYQTLMLPVLRACGDGGEHQTSDLIARMADEFRLSENERLQRLASGSQTVIANRTHWAITYMAQAQLLERSRRGYVRITDRGRQLLASRPERIDKKVLMRNGVDLPKATPVERISAAAAEIERSLRSDLLTKIRDAKPAFFERLIVNLLEKMGYGRERGGKAWAVGRSGDGGIDGMIDQDPLGLDRIYLQAKRYSADNPVGAPAILQFSGALAQNSASRGVFITTSSFTSDAKETAARLPQRIVLINGDRLAELMIRHDVGVSIAETFHVKRIDEDFFEDE